MRRSKRDYDEYEDDEYEDDDYYDDEDEYHGSPRRIWRVALVLFIILLVMVVFAAFVLISPPDVSDSYTLGERQDGKYTLLVAGKDVVGLNTDTMMVCTMDTSAGTLDIVNIPRDTMVNVSWSTKKANSILGGTGSMEGLMNGIGDLLGFVPDNYVLIDMDAFIAVVDAIGGVEFDVPVNMDYDDPEQGLSIHLEAGYQKLDAEQAMGVFRYRQNNDGTGYPEGDIGRIATQQDFLKAVAGQSLKLRNVTKAGTFLSIFDEYVETDLDTGSLLWYGLRFLLLGDDGITFHTVPGNTGAYMDGLSYVALYPNEWMDMVNTYFNPYQYAVTEANVNILTLDSAGNPYVVGGY